MPTKIKNCCLWLQIHQINKMKTEKVLIKMWVFFLK